LPDSIWQRLAAGLGVLLLIVVVGVFSTGLWDSAAPAMYERYISSPAPPVLTGSLLKAFVLLGVAASLLVFFWSALADYGYRIRAWLRTVPREPLNMLDIFDVHARLVEAWKRAVHLPVDALDKEFYDRLRQGVLTAWGRPARRYAPSLKAGKHLPLRRPIPREFWERHVVEDLSKWMEGKTWARTDPRLTTTVPLKGNRNRQRCYWDLAFDREEVHKLWPMPGSWLGR
jgi:hypothetical protein